MLSYRHNGEKRKVNMDDCYTYFNCSNGSCPLIIEEQIYGIRTSTCDDYCGNGFGGCNTCYFEGSDICIECVHNKE